MSVTEAQTVATLHSTRTIINLNSVVCVIRVAVLKIEQKHCQVCHARILFSKYVIFIINMRRTDVGAH